MRRFLVTLFVSLVLVVSTIFSYGTVGASSQARTQNRTTVIVMDFSRPVSIETDDYFEVDSWASESNHLLMRELVAGCGRHEAYIRYIFRNGYCTDMIGSDEIWSATCSLSFIENSGPETSYPSGSVTWHNIACPKGDCSISREDSIFHIAAHGYTNVWFGGFYVERGSQRKVRWCYIDGVDIVCREIATETDSEFSTAPRPSLWPKGHTPGWLTDKEPVREGSVLIGGTLNVVWIKMPGEYFGIETCETASHSVLYLSDDGVPVSVVTAVNNYNTHSRIGHLNEAQSDKFSCAGPIVDKNGIGILPPACGVRTDKGELAFGSFVRSGSLKLFANREQMNSLANYKKNNRSMLFEYGERQITGQNVVMLVEPEASFPLTVTFPSPRVVTGTVSNISAWVFVVTSDGRVARARISTGTGSISIVIPPEIVSEVARSGGEITVRAIAAGDTGEETTETKIFDGGLWCGDSSMHITRYWDSKFVNNMPYAGHIENGWFVPTANFVSFCSVHNRGAHSGTALVQLGYYRYVADVAQASVRLIPVQTRIVVPDNPVRIAIWPDAPQTTGVFVAPGESISVSTDVPLRGRVRLDVSGIRVAVTYTHPISGTVAESLVPKDIRVSGGVLMPPCGLGWATGNVVVRPGGCEYAHSWLRVSGVRIYDMLWYSRTPPSRLDCIRYNVSKCYRPFVQNHESKIEADLVFRASADIPIVIDGTAITQTITVQSDPLHYEWSLPLTQETR